MKHILGIIVLIIAVCAVSAIRADDWPQWRGSDREAISHEEGLMAQWPAEGPALLWEIPLGEGYSSIAVVGNRIYTQYQRDKAQWAGCFDAATGKPVWEIRTGDEFRVQDYHGPRSTPTVDGDRVYILDALGNLHRVQAATGEIDWQKNIIEGMEAKNLQWAVSMSPLIDGEKLIVNPGQSEGNSILALNKETGEIIWKAKDPATGEGLSDLAGYSSPIIRELAGQRQIVLFVGAGALGVSPEEGNLLWHFPWKTSYNVHAATPIVHNDRVFISSGYNVGCAVIEIQPDSPQKAVEIWRNKAIRSHFGTPILYEGHLYGFDDRILTCVDFETGDTKWTNKDFNKGTLVMAGGWFYVLGEKGNLALIEPSPEAFKPVSQFQTILSAKRCWTMPTVANGRLFARDEAKMVCYQVSEAAQSPSPEKPTE
ncbi:PQQ-like beta-propeller repeat protein [bacterium]|nr:PQQ-like beta-propeller repeat protein [bacterium]